MKYMSWLQIGAALFALFVFWAKPAWPQSSNRQAMSWFETGLRESEPQKKIAAYSKASELDPSFVEAWFNLGMAYQEARDYARAEECLRKAYDVKPEKLETALKLKIVYELANVYNKSGKLESYERALHQAKALAGNQEMLARLSFELGRLLHQQQRYDQALVELKEGRRFVKQDRENYENLILLAEKAQRLEKAYARAERERAAGNLKEARALFGEIRAENPKFRNVEARLVEADSLLNLETSKKIFAGLYEEARQHETEGRLEAALAAYENLLRQSAVYKDAEQRSQALRESLEQKRRNEKLESTYAAGAAALRLRDWEAAITSFESALASDPKFRDARKRLSQARRALAQEGEETVAARYYADGVSALQRNDLGGALAAFEKVCKLNPNYRDAAASLKEIEARLAKPSAALASPPVRVQINLDSLYQSALAAEAGADWAQAEAELAKLQVLQADYRDVAARLTAARMKLRQAEAAASVLVDREFSTEMIGGAVAALLTIAILGFVVFSPAARARYRLWRNDPEAAVRIYEKLLERHPRRAQYYPALADIYLRLGRKDERALKAYKTVVQLNLPFRYRDQLNDIVAQKFLVEGRTDQEAIEVLESALKVEQRNQVQAAKKGA